MCNLDGLWLSAGTMLSKRDDICAVRRIPRKNPPKHAAFLRRSSSLRLGGVIGALSQRAFPVLGEIPHQRANHRLTQPVTRAANSSGRVAAFQANAFDVGNLWIEQDGRKRCAEELIKELVDYWTAFFKKYSVS
jgi:hypothetical protein